MNDTVLTSFHVPRHIHKAFKIACAIRNVGMGRTMARMMERYARNTLKQTESPPPQTPVQATTQE